MATVGQPVDADALLQLRDDGRRYELIAGELRMMSPAGGRHGRVAHTLGLLLGGHVRAGRLGVVYAAETGFVLARSPDTVRAPDVAFVSRERAADLDDESGFVTVIPDLVGEIVSPRDAFSDVEEKVLAWLAAGVRLVLVVDPATKTLHAYRSPERVTVLHVEEPASTRICDVSDVVPGFTFAVTDLFV